MEIHTVIETPTGGATFHGVLDQQELDFVVNLGLGELFRQGALPFKSVTPEESYRVVSSIGIDEVIEKLQEQEAKKEDVDD